MAYASGVRLSSLAGIVGAAVGGYIGYSQAGAVSSLTPVQGALILGGVGLVAGSTGAFLLKSAAQFATYVILLGIVFCIFQTQIEQLTGINPVEATLNLLRSLGIPVSWIPGVE